MLLHTCTQITKQQRHTENGSQRPTIRAQWSTCTSRAHVYIHTYMKNQLLQCVLVHTASCMQTVLTVSTGHTLLPPPSCTQRGTFCCLQEVYTVSLLHMTLSPAVPPAWATTAFLFLPSTAHAAAAAAAAQQCVPSNDVCWHVCISQTGGVCAH